MVEDGLWRQGGTHGLEWTDIVTSGGEAYGTQDGLASPEFNDSVACRAAGQYPPNQYVRAVVQKDPGITGIQEIELYVRCTIGPHRINGYEMLWAHDGAYSGVVRWDRASPFGAGYGDGFVGVATGPSGFTPLVTGDVVEMYIEGVDITVLVNGVVFMTADITEAEAEGGVSTVVYMTGQPGFGMFRKNNGGSTNPQSFDISSIEMGARP
jgi:hypothetical protein